MTIESAPPTPRRHVVISGTGRAGTTFLVAFLTRLGLDTGFSESDLALDEVSRAGLEHDIRKRKNVPYVVKSPWLCVHIAEVLARPDIVIEHAIIPVRNIDDAAASRAFVVREAGGPAPGGLWRTDDPAEQAAVLLRLEHALIEQLLAADIPITLLHFRRLIADPGYLFAKLAFLAPRATQADFERAFHRTIRPNWVHDFSAGTSAHAS
ncbi:MAG: hypothetical protein AB7J28_12825 [Hyphomonadaceae bacterium]